MIGTVRYVSINTHKGFEISRRDDLECLAYILIYFARGALPWQGISAPTKKMKYEKIMERKLSTSVETLCRGLDNAFSKFVYFCRELRFDEMPDYGYLRKLLREIALNTGIIFDN